MSWVRFGDLIESVSEGFPTYFWVVLKKIPSLLLNLYLFRPFLLSFAFFFFFFVFPRYLEGMAHECGLYLVCTGPLQKLYTYAFFAKVFTYP